VTQLNFTKVTQLNLIASCFAKKMMNLWEGMKTIHGSLSSPHSKNSNSKTYINSWSQHLWRTFCMSVWSV